MDTQMTSAFTSRMLLKSSYNEESWGNSPRMPPLEGETTEAIVECDDKNLTIVMVVDRLENLPHFPENIEVSPYSCTWEQVPSSSVIIGRG